MKKHGLLLIILALLCVSVFSAAAYADDGLYPLAFTERQTTYNGRTTKQIMEKPYETWYFLNDGSAYVTTGGRYTYTTSVKEEKTVISLDGGIFDNKQITVDPDTDSASAVSTHDSVTDTYIFRVMRNTSLFRAVIDEAIQDGSMLEYTWHAEGGNGGILYRYHIYDSGKKLVESGTTIENSFRFMPEKDDTYTIFLTAVDYDYDVSEYATELTVFQGNPNFVIVDGKVTAYTGTGTAASVPETLGIDKDGKPIPVTKIGSRAFSNASTLEKVYLPNNISEIETNAFSGSRAKILCQIIEKDETTGENKPTATAKELSKKRLNFYDKNNDDECAFELLYMEIDGEADTLALTSYKGSDKNVVIPPDVKYIYNNAFKDKEMVESVSIHNDVTGIGQNAFKGCSRLANVDLKPEAALRSISDGAFDGCGSIKTLELPQNLLSIGERAFANCEGMQKLKLHSDKIANIGAGAFYNCPADIYCDKLESETALNISKQDLPFFNEQGDLTLELHYKDGELVLDNCTGTGKTLNIVCDSLKVISANAFQGNKSLETVSIPASVTRIEDSAFRGCSRLETFSITDAKNSKLLEIGDYAFNGCSQLKAITLPDKLLKIGMHAFSECDAMDEITLPDSVSAIGANAFHNGPKKVYCSSYTAAPAFLVSALPQTFWYKEGTNPELELRWENDNSDLALYSFHGDPDVEVPDYVTEIRADAFEDMKDTLQTVKIPASVTVLPTGLFDGYDTLKKIELFGNKSVENGAIRNCADLESVIGLTDLTVIDTNFDNCPKLRLATPYDKLHNELRLATQPDFAKKAVLLTPPISSDAVILYTNGKAAQLNKTDGTVTAYSEGFTRIYMYAGGKVGSCDVTVYADLPGLVLPQKLAELEEEAFMGKNSFRYALLPDSLTAIGNRAFANNERLLFVYIPDTVDSFGGPDIFPEGVFAVFHDTNTAAQEYCNTYGINWQYMP